MDLRCRLQAACDHLHTLAPVQLRRAAPLLADMGISDDQIRAMLLDDLDRITDHHTAHGEIPCRVYGEHARRLYRLELAGVRLSGVAA